MENRSHALWAGFFTIVMVCATIFAGIWLNRDKTVRTPYRIVTDRAISGLNPQATVRYKGLAVGRVDKISFDPKLIGQIDIDISIDPDTPISNSTFAVLGYQGVTGIAYIQLDDDERNAVKSTQTAGEVRHIPLRPGFFEKLQENSTVILANIDTISKQLIQFLSPENQKTIMGAFTSTTEASKSWAAVANDLQPTLKLLPNLTQNADKTLTSVQELANNANQLSLKLSDLTTQLQDPSGSFQQGLSNFNSVSDQVRSETLPKFTQLTHEATNSMRTLNSTLEELKEHPQDLIFGKSKASPGPGEPGFSEPKN